MGSASQLPNLFIDAVLISSVLLIVMFSLLQGREISSILPMLSLYAIATLRLMSSAKRIISAVSTMGYFYHSVDVIYQDLATTANHGQDTPKPNLQFTHSLELRNIYYRYPHADQPVVQNISLNLHKAESIALIGASGTGKTTIVDLILGLLTPTAGEILIDGIDIAQNLPNWQ